MQLPTAETSERKLVALAVVYPDLDLGPALDVAPELFTHPMRVSIWRACMSVTRSGKPRNLDALEKAMRADGEWPGTDVVSALMKSSDDVLFPTEEIPGLVSDIRMAAKRQRVVRSLHDLADRAKTEDLDEIMAAAQRELAPLEVGGTRRILTVADVVYETVQDIERRANGTSMALSTGLTKLDEMVSGLEPGTVTVIAARPGCGKTALAMSSAIHNAKEGVPVLFCSAEMGIVQLGRRLLAHEASVDVGALRTPTKEQFKRVSHVYIEKGMGNFPMSFTIGRCSITQLANDARRWRSKTDQKKPAMLIVDYLQLLDTGTNDANREREVARMSREIKLLSLDLNVSTLLLSQINRGVEGRDDKRPKPSDLRESGAIEQDSDLILMLYRPYAYNPDDDSDKVEIIIGKAREGDTGTAFAKFEAKYTRFEDAIEKR